MGAGAPLKTPSTNPIPFDRMTRDLALSLLRQGANGGQILEILDTIAADDAAAEPTAEEIQF